MSERHDPGAVDERAGQQVTQAQMMRRFLTALGVTAAAVAAVALALRPDTLGELAAVAATVPIASFAVAGAHRAADRRSA
ncbi:hypothetical protein ACFQLX_01585 [Streptomyces polyrhachis]|uniref:Uncharacterized protein n=1 Tax=Streptomyces polyrhachis TaxID=1282885 RepID=A0ABW2G811_9ACTN